MAWFHPSLINEVSKLEGVLKIEEKPRPINNSSKNQDNLTDLDIIHGVNTWHSAAIIHPASSIANTVIDAIRNRFVQR